MKIVVLQENLKNALNYLQKVVPNKPQITILSSILIEVVDTKMKLSATDLYLGIKTEILAEVEEEGKIAINGELFKNVINSLDKGKITLHLENGALVIQQNKALSRITVQSTEEFPEFPRVEGSELELKAKDLFEVQELVAFCSSLDQSRPVLTSLLFKFSGSGLEVVATDGFRLANLVIQENSLDINETFMISAKAFNELCRLLKQTNSEVAKVVIAQDIKQLLIGFSHVEMYVRLIEGDFPPYEKIIPPEFSLKVGFLSDDFLTELKRAAIFSRDASNIIQLKITDQIMEIHAHSPAIGNYSGEIVIENSSNQSGEIAFNVNYLIDFITAAKAEKLFFSMNESLKPAMFQNPDLKNYFYIAMPFRVNS